MIRIFKSKALKREKLLQMKDEVLIRIYRESSNSEIIGILFERYTHLVFGVCMKYLKNEEDSKDAVMRIFESLFDKLAHHSIENFNAWIYKVSRNHCLMEIRKKNKQPVTTSVNQEIYFEPVFMESSDWMHLMDKDATDDAVELLMKAIAKLRKEQKICIELLYLQHKSYQEVAIATGFSLKSVKSHIQNGKRNLKNMLQNSEK
jgi:RNA polymerase sigma factor (sigma-70 family)